MIRTRTYTGIGFGMGLNIPGIFPNNIPGNGIGKCAILILDLIPMPHTILILLKVITDTNNGIGIGMIPILSGVGGRWVIGG